MKMRSPLAAVLLIGALPSAALAAGDAVMHRDPGCGCCEKWAAMVRTQLGRKVIVKDDSQRAALDRRLGVPAQLSSCHTAIIDGLTFEGHVPIADMKRLLTTRPQGIKGLAVAGMPIGSAGMEVPGAARQPYNVIAFGPAGQRVYARYKS